jgi:hypothetical protein
MMNPNKNIQDILGCLRGHVRVLLHNPGSSDVLWYDDHNVVVDKGRERVAKFLSGETDDEPDTMIIGNGGAEPINNISPNPPSRTDLILGTGSTNGGWLGGPNLEPGQTTSSAAGTKGVSVLRTINQVRYDATFSANDFANTDFPGYGIIVNDALFASELGLITSTASNELFARVTFAPIVFQPGSSTSISVQWTITIL